MGFRSNMHDLENRVALSKGYQEDVSDTFKTAD